MKVALVADIHGNADAFEAVLIAAWKAGAEQLLCAGDYVGYYYQPDRVLSLLDGWAWQGVRGNHEDMLGRWLAGDDCDEIYRRYGSGLAMAAALPEAVRERLLALPPRRDLIVGGRSVLLCHGAPWQPDEYVYPDAPAELRLRMSAEGQDLVVFGHSHYPTVWRSAGTVVVNPGSVGQPRDRLPGASWGLWDTDTMAVDLRREAYDMGALLTRCRTVDPHLPYLADVLKRTD